MIVIYRPRQAGKTSRAIHVCNQNGGYIVCANHERCRAIADKAKEMGVYIPFPITAQEFFAGRYHPAGVKKIVIDDIEDVLQQVSRVPIEAITVTRQSHNE